MPVVPGLGRVATASAAAAALIMTSGMAFVPRGPVVQDEERVAVVGDRVIPLRDEETVLVVSLDGPRPARRLARHLGDTARPHGVAPLLDGRRLDERGREAWTAELVTRVREADAFVLDARRRHRITRTEQCRAPAITWLLELGTPTVLITGPAVAAPDDDADLVDAVENAPGTKTGGVEPDVVHVLDAQVSAADIAAVLTGRSRATGTLPEPADPPGLADPTGPDDPTDGTAPPRADDPLGAADSVEEPAPGDTDGAAAEDAVVGPPDCPVLPAVPEEPEPSADDVVPDPAPSPEGPGDSEAPPADPGHPSPAPDTDDTPAPADPAPTPEPTREPGPRPPSDRTLPPPRKHADPDRWRVPAPRRAGLALTIGRGAVDLDDVTIGTDRLVLSGELAGIRVSDDRPGAAQGWTLSAQVSDLVGPATLPAAHVGWTPHVRDPRAQAGPAVAGALSGGPGLAAPAVLASARGRTAGKPVRLDADVVLETTRDVTPGRYAGVITLTLFPSG